MASRVRPIQNSFTAGEVSPRMFGRTDFDKYFSACELIENWLILPQGGVMRRPGTKFVAEVKNSANRVVLIPFLFNTQQAYALETGPGYFRFYTQSGRLLTFDTDAAVTNGTFPTNITGWTARNSGTGSIAHNAGNQTLQLTSGAAGNEGRAYQEVAIGAAFRNVDHVLAFRAFANDVTMRIGNAIGGAQIKTAAVYETGWHLITFNPGGAASVFIEFEAPASTVSQVDDVSILDNAPLELTNPYVAADLNELQWDQSADTMWITHRNHKPRKLLRFGASDWSLIEYTPTSDPFTSAGNFPRGVAFWKSRLWFAGTNNDPQKVWATAIDNFDDLNPGTGLDAQAITRVVAGGRINVIQWLIPGGSRELLVGTYGSEMLLHGDRDGLVTPAKTSVDDGTSFGSALVRPERADNFSLFIQRGRSRLRQFFFDFDTDKHHATDLTLIAEHILKPGVTQIAYQGDPAPVVWAVRDDGQLPGLTFIYHEKIAGWHRQVTQGSFESVLAIPHEKGDRDQVWVAVKRTIGGSTKRFVEFFDDNDGHYGQLGVDSGLTYNGKSLDSTTLTLSSAAVGTGVTATASAPYFLAGDVGKELWHPSGATSGRSVITGFTSATVVTVQNLVAWTGVGPHTGFILATDEVTNLTHLNGMTVAIVGDGAVYPSKVVTAGAVTLDPPAAVIEAGLPYTSKMVTPRPEVAGSSIQGLTVARGDTTVRVLNTVSLKVAGVTLPDRSSEDLMDAPATPFTGDLQVPTLGWGSDAGKVTIEQDLPIPATVLAIVGNVQVSDE